MIANITSTDKYLAVLSYKQMQEAACYILMNMRTGTSSPQKGCLAIAAVLCGQDQLLLKQTPATFRGVLGAKVAGLLAMAPHLHAAAVPHTLLFSSVSSIVAPLGQPNYAAANAMLNAWASAHSAQVRSTHSLTLAMSCHLTTLK